MIDMMDASNCVAVGQHHHHHQDMVMGNRSHESGNRDAATLEVDHDSSMGVTPKPPQEKKPRPPDEQPLKCPRCDSSNTKFCYYNNYSLTQPRYFCKSCRRYWTKGGTLRNVPVGGGCRKNRKSSVAAAAVASAANNSTTVPCGMMMNSNNYSNLIRRSSHHQMEQYGVPSSAGGFVLGGGEGDQNGMFIGGSNGVLQQALMSAGGYDGNIGSGDHELSLAFARLQHQAGHGGISSLFGGNPNNGGGHPHAPSHLSDIFANHQQHHNFLDSSSSLRGGGTGSAASSFPEMISNMINSTSHGFQDYYYGSSNDGGHYGGSNNNNNNCNNVDHVNESTCRSAGTTASEEITYDHQQQEIISRSNSTTPNSTVPSTPVAASVIKQEVGNNNTHVGGAGRRSEGLFSGFPWQQLNGHSGVGSVIGSGGDLNVHDSSSNGGGSWNVHGLIPSSWHGSSAHLLNSALI